MYDLMAGVFDAGCRDWVVVEVCRPILGYGWLPRMREPMCAQRGHLPHHSRIRQEFHNLITVFLEVIGAYYTKDARHARHAIIC